MEGSPTERFDRRFLTGQAMVGGPPQVYLGLEQAPSIVSVHLGSHAFEMSCNHPRENTGS